MAARELGPPPRDELLAQIEAETRRKLEWCDRELALLEAQLSGDYKRTALLRAQARALERAP
jgi:hypothetical protein